MCMRLFVKQNLIHMCVHVSFYMNCRSGRKGDPHLGKVPCKSDNNEGKQGWGVGNERIYSHSSVSPPSESGLLSSLHWCCLENSLGSQAPSNWPPHCSPPAPPPPCSPEELCGRVPGYWQVPGQLGMEGSLEWMLSHHHLPQTRNLVTHQPLCHW